jgi:hypothetical protein
MLEVEKERECPPPAFRLFEEVIVTGDDNAEELPWQVVIIGEIGEAKGAWLFEPALFR